MFLQGLKRLMINTSKIKYKKMESVCEEEILAANIRFHRAEAEVYDIRHGELFNAFTQRQLKKLVKIFWRNLRLRLKYLACYL